MVNIVNILDNKNILGKTIIIYVLSLSYITSDALRNKKCIDLKETEGTKFFLDKIFKEYGSSRNNSNLITLSKFRKLMESLSIGKVFIECEAEDVSCHQNHLGLLSSKRKRRSEDEDEDGTDHDKEDEEHKKHWVQHLSEVFYF